MKKIPLTNSGFALVDDADYEKVSGYKWFKQTIGKTSYAKCTSMGQPLMHAWLFGEKGKIVDHANHDGLDNRRSNIRLCDHSRNLANQPATTSEYKKHSRYKGVSWCHYKKRWIGQVVRNRKAFRLGHFKEENEAALAYNIAAKLLFGEYAWLNRMPLDTALTDHVRKNLSIFWSRQSHELWQEERKKVLGK